MARRKGKSRLGGKKLVIPDDMAGGGRTVQRNPGTHGHPDFIRYWRSQGDRRWAITEHGDTWVKMPAHLGGQWVHWTAKIP